MNWEYREIRREDLLEDDLYCLRYRVEGKELSGRIRSYSFINPVLVLSRKDRFQVLSGFRRLHGLRVLGQERISAAVLSGTEDVPPTLFRMALLLNEPSSYGELDKTVIVSKARRHFDLSWKELESLAPLFGLPPSQKVLEDYEAVADLPEEFKDRVQDGKAVFKTALGLLQMQPEDQRVMIENVFRHCEFSASESLEVMEWLSDLSRGEKTSFLQVIQKKEIRDLLSSGDVPRSKGTQLHQYLRRRHFPTLCAWEEEYKKMSQKIAASDQIKLTKSPFFEGDSFELTLKMDSMKQYAELLSLLRENEAVFKQLFDLVK